MVKTNNKRKLLYKTDLTSNISNIKEKRFRIAFSFPGEYRYLVDKIAKEVANIFF